MKFLVYAILKSAICLGGILTQSNFLLVSIFQRVRLSLDTPKRCSQFSWLKAIFCTPEVSYGV